MIKMKLNITLFLVIQLCLPTFCFSNEASEFEILQLLKSAGYKEQYKAIKLLNNLNKPNETIIKAVFQALKTPKLAEKFSYDCERLIAKWGKLSMPFLIQALNDKFDFNHWRAPGIIRNIAGKHGPETIIPAIPGLINCIKDKDFQEKEDAIWALASLKERADDAIEALTEEMNASADTDIHWSILVAEALAEIAGSDYPPLQPFLKKKVQYEEQHVNDVDERKFQLEIGFDISRIKFKKEKMEHQLVVHPSEWYPSRKIKYRSIIYDIAIDENKIVYISTSDANFRTDEGYKIGDTLKKLKEDGISKIEEMPGWGYYVELKSGWCAAFCEGNSCTGIELNNDSKIDWFFEWAAPTP